MHSLGYDPWGHDAKGGLTLTLSAAGVAAILALTVSMPASATAGYCSMRKCGLNGTSTNGIKLNGARLNGWSLNGVKLNGLTSTATSGTAETSMAGF